MTSSVSSARQQFRVEESISPRPAGEEPPRALVGSLQLPPRPWVSLQEVPGMRTGFGMPHSGVRAPLLQPVGCAVSGTLPNLSEPRALHV